MPKENKQPLKEINKQKKNQFTKAAKHMKALFFLLEYRTPPLVPVDGIGLRKSGSALAITGCLLSLGV